ncbi:hypothetical protein VTN77DRAFT_6868 [Rasamsonia byssochlamydoides]|uniref:uncharacterized protein n=1 Tax=Rasamsonia byssochlamydoides TaxID=89139 RepID=UPI0037422E01
MSDPMHYRPIAPGPSLPVTGTPSGTPSKNLTPGWKKRVSTACLACKKSKRKCSGVPPCDNCRALHRECIFDESLDQRRRVAAKRTAEELEYHRDMLNDLFKLIRSADETRAQRLLEIIRNDATPEEVRLFIDETLADIQARTPPGELDRKTTVRLKELRRRANLQGPTPSFRRKVMDVNFLCDTPPIRVPAKPWTKVTDDDEFVSHLMSLYFTWDYPFYAFLDRDVFVKHMMAGTLESDFCSPFLVNAILANACHFSEFSEAYAVPGDVTTKGADFLREAERLWDDERDKVKLATLQGSLLLYERYSMSGKDDLGYAMLNKAIDIAASLGYVGDDDTQIDLSDQSADLAESTTRTVWGLYQVDTVAHTGFLKPSRIKHVRLKRLRRASLEEETESWIAYPNHKPPRPAYNSAYFDEACTLSEIAGDVSRTLFVEDEELDENKDQLVQTVDSLYRNLKQWHDGLPSEFDPACKPAAHILLLHIRYYTTLISMFICPRGVRNPPKTFEKQKHEIEGADSASIGVSSARAIAQLVRIHQNEYGMSRSHIFALYAVNLALFVLLDQEEKDSFDFFDPDFVALASAFSVITSRSALGQEVRSIFKQSFHQAIKTKDGKRAHRRLPEELKEILQEEQLSSSDTEEEESASSSSRGRERGGESVTDEETSADTSSEQEQEQGSTATALCEMLCRYEVLSLGKEEQHSDGDGHSDGEEAKVKVDS